MPAWQQKARKGLIDLPAPFALVMPRMRCCRFSAG